MSGFLNNLFAFIFVFSVVYALVSDFARLRIPNAIPVVLTVAFAGYALAGGTPSVWPHLGLAAAVFVLFFIFFAVGWVAAGDAKFLPSVMLWAGPGQAARFVILMAIIGGVFAAGILAWRHALNRRPALAGLPGMAKISRWARNGLLPYGIPISLAALAVAPAIFAAPGVAP